MPDRDWKAYIEGANVVIAHFDLSGAGPLRSTSGVGSRDAPTIFADAHDEHAPRVELLIGDPAEGAPYLWTPLPPDAPRFVASDGREHGRGWDPPVSDETVSRWLRWFLADLQSRGECIDVRGTRWRTLRASLADQSVTSVRFRRGGLFVEIARVGDAQPVLPLREGSLRASIGSSDTERWAMKVALDPVTGALHLSLLFSADGASTAVGDALRERVRSVMQRPAGATLEIVWVHGALLDVPPGVDARGNEERALPTITVGIVGTLSRTLAYPAGSSIYETESGWKTFNLPGGDRSVRYKPGAREGEYEYLPTRFELGLGDDGRPFSPSLYLRPGPGAAPGDGDYRVAITLRAVPVLDPEDRELLRAEIQRRESLPFVTLSRARDLPATFDLDATAAGDALALVGAPRVDLRSGFPITLDVSASGYGLLTEQLVSGYVRGVVSVDLGAERPTIEARLSLKRVVASLDVTAAPPALTLKNPAARQVELRRAVVTVFAIGPDDRLSARNAALRPAPPIVFEANASRVVEVDAHADGPFAWTGVEVDLDELEPTGVVSPRLWADAVNRDYVASSARFPLTVWVVNRKAVTEQSHPGFFGLSITLSVEGAPGRNATKTLLRDDAWHTAVELSLAELTRPGGADARYVVEFTSVYADSNGLPQRVRDVVGKTSELVIRVLPCEPGRRYDVIADDDSTVLGAALSRADAERLISDLRRDGRCWSLRVVA